MWKEFWMLFKDVLCMMKQRRNGHGIKRIITPHHFVKSTIDDERTRAIQQTPQMAQTSLIILRFAHAFSPRFFVCFSSVCLFFGSHEQAHAWQ